MRISNKHTCWTKLHVSVETVKPCIQNRTLYFIRRKLPNNYSIYRVSQKGKALIDHRAKGFCYIIKFYSDYNRKHS